MHNIVMGTEEGPGMKTMSLNKQNKWLFRASYSNSELSEWCINHLPIPMKGNSGMNPPIELGNNLVNPYNSRGFPTETG